MLNLPDHFPPIMDFYNLVFAFGAALAAGFLNAIAMERNVNFIFGAGCNRVFPRAANIAKTMSLFAGYSGTMIAYDKGITHSFFKA